MTTTSLQRLKQSHLPVGVHLPDTLGTHIQRYHHQPSSSSSELHRNSVLHSSGGRRILHQGSTTTTTRIGGGKMKSSGRRRSNNGDGNGYSGDNGESGSVDFQAYVMQAERSRTNTQKERTKSVEQEYRQMINQQLTRLDSRRTDARQPSHTAMNSVNSVNAAPALMSSSHYDQRHIKRGLPSMERMHAQRPRSMGAHVGSLVPAGTVTTVARLRKSGSISGLRRSSSSADMQQQQQQPNVIVPTKYKKKTTTRGQQKLRLIGTSTQQQQQQPGATTITHLKSSMGPNFVTIQEEVVASSSGSSKIKKTTKTTKRKKKKMTKMKKKKSEGDKSKEQKAPARKLTVASLFNRVH